MFLVKNTRHLVSRRTENVFKLLKYRGLANANLLATQIDTNSAEYKVNLVKSLYLFR